MTVAQRLHSDDYQLITPNGSTHTKTSYLSDVASGQLEYLVFEPISPIAALEAAGLIVLRYVARIRLKVNVDDEVEFNTWHTDAYQLREGAWQVVWSQATTIDPAPTG
jgi:hypothetical protein